MGLKKHEKFFAIHQDVDVHRDTYEYGLTMVYGI
jgi:hypothetical protein